MSQSMDPDMLDDRLKKLEDSIAQLATETGATDKKDIWDKLSALSAVISGVIIGLLGLLINTTLTTNQSAMDERHNATLHQEAVDRLDLEQKRINNELMLELARGQNQQDQAKAARDLQNEQFDQSLTLQKSQAAQSQKLEELKAGREVAAQIAEKPELREVDLKLLARYSPEAAVIAAEKAAIVSSNPARVEEANATLATLAASADPSIRSAATEAIHIASLARREQAITDVLEVGAPFAYGQVYNRGGRIVYGRGIFASDSLVDDPETNAKVSSLYVILRTYMRRPDAKSSGKLLPFMERVKVSDPSLVTDDRFIQVLHEAGADPVMADVQDERFNQHWKTAEQLATEWGLKLPLSKAFLYDLRFNLGPQAVFMQFPKYLSGPKPRDGADEREWVRGFVEILAQSAAVGRRYQAFKLLIEQDNWELNVPFRVRNVEIK